MDTTFRHGNGVSRGCGSVFPSELAVSLAEDRQATVLEGRLQTLRLSDNIFAEGHLQIQPCSQAGPLSLLIRLGRLTILETTLDSTAGQSDPKARSSVKLNPLPKLGQRGLVCEMIRVFIGT